MMCCSKVKPTTGCVIRLLIAILLVSFIVYIIADFSTVKHFILAFIKWVGTSSTLAIGQHPLGYFPPHYDLYIGYCIICSWASPDYRYWRCAKGCSSFHLV